MSIWSKQVNVVKSLARSTTNDRLLNFRLLLQWAVVHDLESGDLGSDVSFFVQRRAVRPGPGG